MARFDLLRATNSLACKLTKWDKTCDLQLRRLVAYIWSSLGKRLVGYVSKDDKQSGLHLYTDADLGGCPDTQRSTTGVFLLYKGGFHHVPPWWLSVKGSPVPRFLRLRQNWWQEVMVWCVS